jgi:cell division protease FtsH
MALKATRDFDVESPLQDALYVEKISRLLPTYSISSRIDDDVVLGFWLTGGASISPKSFRRLRQTVSWLGARHLKDVVEAAGFEVLEVIPAETRTARPPKTDETPAGRTESLSTSPEKNPAPNSRVFDLAGRPELAAFFNEHIVDIVQNRDRYKALGINFPSAVVLHGPPGCGKTFAVERLIDFLGWPNFQIDASSVASPYIHETSRKVAEVFDNAMENAPSVLVIDEMEAFLADREIGSGHHRVEEVAEFLRRIPEATSNDVLIVAMTNRVEMIDPAILRRGRFDHVIQVNYASEQEVLSLLEKLLSTLPKERDVDRAPLARDLAGRPLSDVAFIVREGARLAARLGKDKLDQANLTAALQSASARKRVRVAPPNAIEELPQIGRGEIGFQAVEDRTFDRIEIIHATMVARSCLLHLCTLDALPSFPCVLDGHAGAAAAAFQKTRESALRLSGVARNRAASLLLERDCPLVEFLGNNPQMRCIDGLPLEGRVRA